MREKTGIRYEHADHASDTTCVSVAGSSVTMNDESPEIAGIHVAEFHHCAVNVNFATPRHMLKLLERSWDRLASAREKIAIYVPHSSGDGGEENA